MSNQKHLGDAPIGKLLLQYSDVYKRQFISLSWLAPQLGQVQFLNAKFFTSLFL